LAEGVAKGETNLVNNRFATWVKQRGIKKLSDALGVHRTTVHNWIAYRNLPETKYAAEIITQSIEHPPADGRGPLTYDDIYSGHPLPPVLPVTAPCEARA
jgi:hypothetical protein